MPLEAITNFVALADDIGTSGQPTREQFADIASAGYEAVINLALPTSDHALADEGSIVTALGLAYVHIPVLFDAPKLADVRAFIGVMRALEGRRKWVHCVANLRVSAFCFHYLHHVRGLDAEAARSPMFEKWEPRMTPVWRELLAFSTAEVLGPAQT
jgi:protein tyrosine phosphatase (PTP) superfamily phosphohydrolase (DUF442 family)